MARRWWFRKKPRPDPDGTFHVPVLRSIRERGKNPEHLHKTHVWPWLLVAGSLLGVLVFLSFWSQVPDRWVEGPSIAIALWFFVLALAHFAGLQRRAPFVATAVTILLYGLTAWTPLVGVETVFVLSVLVSFLLFLLAGFNILFVVEEMVFDVHRLVHIRRGAWLALPTLVVLGTVPVVYFLAPLASIRFATVQVAVPVAVFMIVVAWIVRWRVGQRGLQVVREAHLVAVGSIVGAAVADIMGLLRGSEGLLPSFIAYIIILGTWLFVSYTTLHRARYFIPKDDVLPWLALLFASAFAVLAHVHAVYDAAGTLGLQTLQDLRINYLIIGAWIGLAFFFLRGAWRVLRFIRDERRLGQTTRRTAGRAARLMEELLGSSKLLERLTRGMFDRVDRALPGQAAHPKRRRRRRGKGPDEG